MRQELATVLGVLVILSFCTASFAQRQCRAGDLRREGKLKVGDPAPDFNLKKVHGKGKVKLSSFKGKRPVVLIFGSYT